MKVGFALKHHDWPYVERRGGIELLTHLRGASARAEGRRASVDRALAHFRAAEDRGAGDAETGGYGLIVMQRALLCAEDLGGLLHAFRDDDTWERLRGATIDTIDAAFMWALHQPVETLPKVFVLADRDVLAGDGMAESDIEVVLRLRARVTPRWQRMLETAGTLWFPLRGVAKATMHGFPVLAGEFFVEPPGAGELGDGIAPSPDGRFAVAVTSSERRYEDDDGAERIEVRTDRALVRLDAAAIAGYAASGKVAARLYSEICEAQAESRMRGYAAGIPFFLASTLSSDDQARLEAMAAEQGEDD